MRGGLRGLLFGGKGFFQLLLELGHSRLGQLRLLDFHSRGIQARVPAVLFGKLGQLVFLFVLQAADAVGVGVRPQFQGQSAQGQILFARAGDGRGVLVQVLRPPLLDLGNGLLPPAQVAQIGDPAVKLRGGRVELGTQLGEGIEDGLQARRHRVPCLHGGVGPL